MHRTRLLAPVLILIVLITPLSGTTLAQDGSENPNPDIMICITGTGCWHSEKSGEITTEQMSNLIGENETGNNTVACTLSDGCQWSGLGPEDLDVVYGGDAQSIGDKKPAPEQPANSEYLFPDLDIGDDPIIPQDGSWIAYHLAGVMDCGVMKIDIPAGQPQPGMLIVEDNGATLTAETNDPEMEIVPMHRVQNGVYVANLEIETEDGTMILYYDEVFIAATMAIGLIHGEMNSQGVECVITRPFFTVVDGLEHFESKTGEEDEDTEDLESEDTESE